MDTSKVENESSVHVDVVWDQKAAILQGKPIEKLPDDLYIPPDALRVILDLFQGPLDLLLYLIKRHDMDILDIQIAVITEQYMRYINAMDVSQFELIGDYLVMAATLAEIKSKMLLPKQETEDEEEEDPRAALVRRLQEYERFKKAAEQIDSLDRVGRDIALFSMAIPFQEKKKIDPDVDLEEIYSALSTVIKRSQLLSDHVVEKEVLSIREKMVYLMQQLGSDHFISWAFLLKINEGRLGVVVTLLALLELMKESLIDWEQQKEYGVIHIKARPLDYGE